MKVSIEKPCLESWEQMNDLGQSRFCASCQKCVTDFTQMSDRAIIQFLQEQSGEVCGRFNESQLERNLFAPRLKQNKYLMALFSMTLVSSMSLLQETQVRPLIPWQIAPWKKDSVAPSQNPSLTAPDSTLLGGMVQDSATGKPLVGAIVLLQDTTIGAKTDEKGQFEFKVANHLLREKNILNIFYTDYEFKIIDLSTVSIEHPLFILLEETPVACLSKTWETQSPSTGTMGMVFLPHREPRKLRFRDKVKRFFKKK